MCESPVNARTASRLGVLFVPPLKIYEGCDLRVLPGGSEPPQVVPPLGPGM